MAGSLGEAILDALRRERATEIMEIIVSDVLARAPDHTIVINKAEHIDLMKSIHNGKPAMHFEQSEDGETITAMLHEWDEPADPENN
jgi:hypothetical protein